MKDDFNTRLNEIQVQHIEEIKLLKLTINEHTGRIELLENKSKKAEKARVPQGVHVINQIYNVYNI